MALRSPSTWSIIIAFLDLLQAEHKYLVLMNSGLLCVSVSAVQQICIHPWSVLACSGQDFPLSFSSASFFLLICLLKGKTASLCFSPGVTGLLSLGTLPCFLGTILHHVFYEQVAQIVKSIHRLLAEGFIIFTTWGALLICIRLILYISSDFCFSCQCVGELWKAMGERMRWQLWKSQKHVQPSLFSSEASVQTLLCSQAKGLTFSETAIANCVNRVWSGGVCVVSTAPSWAGANVMVCAAPCSKGSGAAFWCVALRPDQGLCVLQRWSSNLSQDEGQLLWNFSWL